MNVERLVPLILTALFLGFIAVEALRPARPLPRVTAWKLRGAIAFLVTGAVSSNVAHLCMDFARAHRWMDLERLGVLGGAAVAFVCFELVNYWVHRLSHVAPFFRLYHQVHHSPERV